MSLRALALSLLVIPAALTAQRDTVLLARDIDGTGKPDRIAIEHKKGKEYPTQRLMRTALYLDQKLKWSSTWSDEVDGGLIDTVMTIPGGGSLVQLGYEFGDAGITTLLFARNGRLRLLVEHAIGYDDGDYKLRSSATEITVDASLAHLKANGKDVISSIRCRAGTIPMAQLVLDQKREMLTLRRQYCATPKPQGAGVHGDGL